MGLPTVVAAAKAVAVLLIGVDLLDDASMRCAVAPAKGARPSGVSVLQWLNFDQIAANTIGMGAIDTRHRNFR